MKKQTSSDTIFTRPLFQSPWVKTKKVLIKIAIALAIYAVIVIVGTKITPIMQTSLGVLGSIWLFLKPILPFVAIGIGFVAVQWMIKDGVKDGMSGIHETLKEILTELRSKNR